MSDDDEEMYALALGEEYMPSDSTSTTTIPVSETETQHKCPSLPQPNPKDPTAQTELFRQLLVGSRSQITKLKGENEKLKINLNDAVTSSGVVTCPNCTHNFKERHFTLRPRAMKKIKARNCVELEFGTADELQSWLYLNQLETNNDGMPTVMDVKKPSRVEESLKSVGSLLPDLHEKKKVDDGKKVRMEVSEKRNRTSMEKKIEEKKKNERSHEKHDSRFPRRDQFKEPESKESERRRNSKESSRSGSSHDHKFRQATSKDCNKNKEKSSRDGKREHDEAPRKNRPNHSETHKRKLSPPEDDVRDSKAQKRTIIERVQFPSEKKDSPSEFESIIKEISTSVERATKSSHRYSASTSESCQATKSNRQPIVWTGSKPDATPEKTEFTSIPFEFKVKSMEKKSNSEPPVPAVTSTRPRSVVDNKEASQVVPPAQTNVSLDKVSTHRNLPSSSKYKFVPTSKKNSVPSADEMKESMESTEKAPISAVEENIFPPNIEGDSSTTQSASTSGENKVWKLIPIQKPTAFHKRAQEIREMWSERMKIHNEVTFMPENYLSSTIDAPVAQTSAQVASNYFDSLPDNRTQIDIRKINLQEVGISSEGLAMLQRLKTNKKLVEEPMELEVGDLGKNITENEKNGSASFKVSPGAGTTSSSHAQKLSTSDKFHFETEKDKSGGEDDEFREFFPDIVIARQAPPTSVKVDVSRRQYSTGSFSSMMDREEDELQFLVREDSAVPPSGDYLLDVGLDQCVSGLSPEPKETEQNGVQKETDEFAQKNWEEEFCLEDLDEEIDDSTRERKILEMEKLETTVEEEMEWTASQEDDQSNGDVYNETPKENRENSQTSHNDVSKGESPSTRRPMSLKMGLDFRLSDDENAESPRTSTPSRSGIPDDLSEHPDELNDILEEVVESSDSFIDALDWNYGTDYEDENEENEKEVDDEGEKPGDGVGGTDDTEFRGNGDQLEEGEISEEEEIEVKIVEEKKKEEPKKAMRERVKYVVEERQIRGESPEPERDRHRRHRYDRERSRRSPDRRRSSGENYKHNKKRDTRPATYGSLLKRRN